MLNGPRTVPYDFKVFSMDGVVWLYDNSSRHFLCSAQAMIWAEPLYWWEPECDDILPDADYFDASGIEGFGPVDIASYPADVSEKEAWNDAREDAHANHRL